MGFSERLVRGFRLGWVGWCGRMHDWRADCILCTPPVEEDHHFNVHGMSVPRVTTQEIVDWFLSTNITSA